MFFGMNKQISFSNLDDRNDRTKAHGGSLARGKRKSKRPLDRKKPLHVVLKASNSHTLLKNQAEADFLLQVHLRIVNSQNQILAWLKNQGFIVLKN